MCGIFFYLPLKELSNQSPQIKQQNLQRTVTSNPTVYHKQMHDSKFEITK